MKPGGKHLPRRCRNRIGNDGPALQTADGAGFFACVREDAINEAAMEAAGGGCGSLGRQIESWTIHGALRREPKRIFDPNLLRIITESFE